MGHIYYALAFFAISSIAVVVYIIWNDYSWSRAYNHGFVDGKKHTNDSALISWRTYSLYKSNRLRRAYALGARHAKGY